VGLPPHHSFQILGSHTPPHNFSNIPSVYLKNRFLFFLTSAPHHIHSTAMDEHTPTRCCSKCGTTKSVKEFSVLGGTRYLRPECRGCMKKYTQHMKELRSIWDKVRPGNDHCCPVCHRSGHSIPSGEHGPAGRNKWCLDHDHGSGGFRGWLCHSCNLLIGRLEKLGGAEVGERAIRYLRGEIPPPPPPPPPPSLPL